MKHLRSSVILGLLALLLFSTAMSSTITTGDGSLTLNDGYKSRQSDVATTDQNTTYYMTVSGASATFKNNSMNYFMASVDIVEFGPDVVGWYDVGFYYRFQNNDVNFTHVDEALKVGRVSPGQMFFDHVFEVYVNGSTFPSNFTLDLAIVFTENGMADDYGRMSNFWRNIITLKVDNDAPVATITPRNGYNVTSTATETEVVTATVTNTQVHHSLTFTQYASTAYYDINTPYNLTWTIEGDLPKYYRVNVTSTNTSRSPHVMKQGSWTSGVPITVDSIVQTQREDIYTYLIEANDDTGNYIYHTVEIVVVNMTYWTEQYPGIDTEVAGRLFQGQVPVPSAPIFIGLFATAYMVRRRKQQISI